MRNLKRMVLAGLILFECAGIFAFSPFGYRQGNERSC